MFSQIVFYVIQMSINDNYSRNKVSGNNELTKTTTFGIKEKKVLRVFLCNKILWKRKINSIITKYFH